MTKVLLITELEKKILSCYGRLKPCAIAKTLDIKVSKVYSTLNKFGKPVKSTKEYEPYGRKIPKKRSKNTERITKPYKTTQLG